MIKVIKSDADCETALHEIEQLVDRNPKAGSPEADQLELLTLLVRDYESKRFEIPLPDPIEAIAFRMEQQDLSRRDLVPFIGSRSRVSEVLSRKRPLTLAMIRALHAGLGIPAKVLLQEHEDSERQDISLQWERFPLREMASRGWIKEEVSDVRGQARDVLASFFAGLGHVKAATALYRRERHTRSARNMDPYALTAWTARIMIQARKSSPSPNYKPGTVDLQFMRAVARLSVFDRGPLLAREYLAKNGIALVIETALSRTYLDGAAMLSDSNQPIIGLTLRHDRLDNFWFCLMHELAHISIHLAKERIYFYDDLDLENDGDAKEKEADSLAGEALIPIQEWRKSPASRLRSPEAAQHLAKQLGIHPAIVAGRIRHHFKSYRVLNQVVGYGQVRKLFTAIDRS